VTGERYTLTGLAVPDELKSLHDLLAQVTQEHPSLPAADVMMLETAVMEIAGNVVEHGRPSGQVRWTFTLEVGPPLRATLADSGEAYAETWTAEMPDVMSESGRGLALADAVLVELLYARSDGVNVWTMVREVGRASS
jgi:serine/threonine-protein kinase RsbW